MAHIVYRAINRPIKLLWIEWTWLFKCFGAMVATFIFTGGHFLWALFVFMLSYTVCRLLTKDEDPKYAMLLWRKYSPVIPFLPAKYRQKQILDPMMRPSRPRTVIYAAA